MWSRRACRALGVGLLGLTVSAACSFDRGDRWLAAAEDPPPVEPQDECTPGALRCSVSLDRCVEGPDGPSWVTEDDCGKRGLVCPRDLLRCAECEPNRTRCSGTELERCAADGGGYAFARSCAGTEGVTCRDGACVKLCDLAREQRSNVGCEYWAVDLDNANVDDSLNAAAQQFAVVVSNPQPDLAATVTIEQDDTQVGGPGAPYPIASTQIPPFSLRVFRLGPREVDGSPAGEFDTGTHTALTRHAFRITTTVPVVAFQFNPLENVNVFSNDASLLKPVEAIDTGRTMSTAYVVLGWPQTIAATDDPNTNFGGTPPLELRAFLTIVGTRATTRVKVKTAARVIHGGPIPETAPGETVEFTLDPFDVANLETRDFNADFSGSVIEADGPVVVFSGNEASDAPWFDRLGNRQCCADHLEEQLDPVRTSGRRFVATVSANRTAALARAGATGLSFAEAPEYFRVAATTAAGAVVRTTLPPPDDEVVLEGLASVAEIRSTRDFAVESTEPISLVSISASQGAAGVPRGLPGGDPSLLVIPPIEQSRSTYVFLTPDNYAFDFVRIVTPPDTVALLDGDAVDTLPSCERAVVPAVVGSSPPEYWVYRCQLGFPIVDTALSAEAPLLPGIQLDGVHEIVADRKIGVLVDGFDRNVSYAYAGGTELVEIVPR